MKSQNDTVLEGNMLKSLRVEVNLTQAQLADNLGITSAMVSHWETGKKRISRMQSLALKCALLERANTPTQRRIRETIPKGEVVYGR